MGPCIQYSWPPKNCMQNSEAIQAWFQGKMASFRILGLVSKNEIRSREFSFSSRSLRVKIINLDLVSMPEIGGNFFSVSSRSLRVSVRNSRSRLDERDWIRETLILVSRLKKRLSQTTAMNMAEYGSRQSEQPQKVNFEPIIRGLKSETKCKFFFINVRFNCKRKKGVKNGWLEVPLGGGGGKCYEK